MTQQKKSQFWSLFAISLLWSGLLVWPAAGVAQTSSTFSGQATAANAAVLGVSSVISATGSLASSGDALEAALVAGSVPNLLSLENAHATTIGQVGQTD